MTEAEKLEKKYDKIVEEKFVEPFYHPTSLFEQDKPEWYAHDLEIFNWLFAQGEEAQIYLWNKMYDSGVPTFGLKHVVESDFSAEELQFLKNVEQACRSHQEKYGTSDDHTNINPKIETNRLVLTPFNDELDVQYNKYFLRNAAEFEWYYSKEYDKVVVSCGCRPILQQLSFAVLTKDTNEFVGSVVFLRLDTDVLYNIEYFIMPSYRQKDYAYEAVKRLLDELFSDRLLVLNETVRKGVYDEVPPDVKCVRATIRTDNAPSIQLAERLNFKRDGILRYNAQLHGKYYDFYVYTLEK